MGHKQGQIWMSGGVPVAVMSRREDGVPEEVGTLDEDNLEDDEDPVLVDEITMPGHDVNPFGTEEYNFIPMDDLGLDEGASEVEMPPAELEEQMEDDIIDDDA